MQFDLERKLIRKNMTQNNKMKFHPKFLVTVKVGSTTGFP